MSKFDILLRLMASAVAVGSWISPMATRFSGGMFSGVMPWFSVSLVLTILSFRFWGVAI